MSTPIHKHTPGEVLTQFFVGQINSDQTEGRGRMVDTGAFLNTTDAYASIKGEAVMGCGDGDIVFRSYRKCRDCPEIIRVDKKIYHGDNYFKKNLAGTNSYPEFMPDGWHVDYSDMASDPEYKEYIRLREKFGQ